MTWKCTNTAKGDNKLYSDAKGVVPSLDLRFAEGKNLNDYMTGQNLITFSRSSIGTYVDENGIIQTATADTPRFDHDPTTGESLGLLVEESRTNSIAYSEDLSNAWWAKSSVNLTSIAVSNPFNYPQVFRVRADTALTGHHLRPTTQQFNANTHNTFSLFAAPEGTGPDSGMIQLRVYYLGTSAAIVNFNLNTGQFNAQDGTSGTSSAGATWSISDYGMEPFAGGWYRVWMTYQASATTSVGVTLIDDINASDVGGIYSYTGSGTGGSYFAGIQVEAGSFKTSVIPTTGTALTRSADVASITGTNFSSWYNQSEGTVFADCTVIGDNTLNQFIYSISDGALGDEIRAFKPSGNDSFVTAIEDSVNGITNNQFGNTNSPFGVPFAFAHAFANNNTNRAINGVASTTDTTVTIPSVNQMRIGARMNATFPSSIYLRRLTYFPERLPDSTLQTITTP